MLAAAGYDVRVFNVISFKKSMHYNPFAYIRSEKDILKLHRLGQNEAGVRLAEAALELARLNLSYTIIIAPCDGTTGKKEILEGQLVQPGQTMVDIVDSSDLWVIANYQDVTTVTAECAGVEFTVKGSVVKQTGWRAVYGEEKEEITIPGWQEGDTLTPKGSSITEGKTKPKPLHTDCLLYTSRCV